MGYGKLYNTVKTSSTIELFLEDAIYAWNNVVGVKPTKQQICLLYAKYAHETGNGKFQYNWNCGNIKKTLTDSHQDGYYRLKGTWEIVKGKKVVFGEDNPTSYFRNYNSQIDGLTDYLKLVSSPRFRTAWKVLVLSPDPLTYCQKLKDCGYYTDTVENYYKGVSYYYNVAMRTNVFETVMQKINTNIIISEEQVINITKQDIDFQPYFQIDYLSYVDDTIKKNMELTDSKISLSFIKTIINFILKLLSELFQ